MTYTRILSRCDDYAKHLMGFAISPDSDVSHNYSKHLARIVGPDPKYLLKRDFLRYTKVKHAQRETYYYDILQDGVYEAGIKYFDPDDPEKVIRTEREYIAVTNEGAHWFDLDIDPWEDMNAQILFAAERIRRGLPYTPFDDD